MSKTPRTDGFAAALGDYSPDVDRFSEALNFARSLEQELGDQNKQMPHGGGMSDSTRLARLLQQTLDEHNQQDVITVIGTRRDWLLIIAALRIVAARDDRTT